MKSGDMNDQSLSCLLSEAGRKMDVRQYVRRPDPKFWLEVLAPLPSATEHEQVRRARMTRYATGIALMLAILYSLLTPFGIDAIAPVLFWVNLLAASGYGLSMWMAALQNTTAARCILITTMLAHVGSLIWFTGDALGVSVYCVPIAALSRNLFSEDEKMLRVLYIFPAMGLFAVSMAGLIPAHVDIDQLDDTMRSCMRALNALLSTESLIILMAIFQREVRRGEQDLIAERERSDRLLHAILPAVIADQLRAQDRMIADRFPEVTVLFADIAGFTPWASQNEPEVVVGLLEKIFTRFDRCTTQAGAEKIKTIGDAYMVISGAPDPCNGHGPLMARLALAFRDEVKAISLETGIPLDVRIGLHTGPVIAGVIGVMRFSYDVWGDTVNTASRMESHGEAGRIHLSAETRAVLPDEFVCEPRGEIQVKGKGAMQTFWLEGVRELAP